MSYLSTKTLNNLPLVLTPIARLCLDSDCNLRWSDLSNGIDAPRNHAKNLFEIQEFCMT